MIREYIQAAMEKAKYEIIDDPEPYYGSVPGLIRCCVDDSESASKGNWR